MRNLLLFVVISVHASANAQSFEQAWRGGGTGADMITSIAPCPDGTTVFAGVLTPNAELLGVAVPIAQAFVAKADQDGQLLWVQPAGTGGAYMYAVPAVAVDDSGSVFVTGLFNDTTVVGDTVITGEPFNNFFLARFAPDGALQWALTAGVNTISVGLALTPEGDPVVAGYFSVDAVIGGTAFTPYGGSGVDIFTARFDRNGGLTWARQAGGAGFYSDAAYDVEVDGEGNVLITGKNRNLSQFGDLSLQCTITDPDCTGGFVAKYDSAGNIQWVKNAGMGCHAVDADAAGNVYITGDHSFDLYFDSLLVEGHSGTDHYTAKLDPDGNYQWVLVPTEGLYEWTYDIVTDPMGTSYVAALFKDTMLLDGHIASDDNYGDFLLYAVDADGDVQWMRHGGLPSPGFSAAYSVALDDDCGVFVGGTFGNTSSLPLDTMDLGAADTYELWFAQLDECDLVTGTGTVRALEEWTLFPDPVVDVLQWSRSSSADHVRITDVRGSVVRDVVTAGQVDVRSLRPGVYMINVTGAAGRVHQARFVKQ